MDAVRILLPGCLAPKRSMLISLSSLVYLFSFSSSLFFTVKATEVAALRLEVVVVVELVVEDVAVNSTGTLKLAAKTRTRTCTRAGVATIPSAKLPSMRMLVPTLRPSLATATSCLRRPLLANPMAGTLLRLRAMPSQPRALLLPHLLPPSRRKRTTPRRSTSTWPSRLPSALRSALERRLARPTTLTLHHSERRSNTRAVKTSIASKRYVCLLGLQSVV